jgi:hypothetical protein
LSAAALISLAGRPITYGTIGLEPRLLQTLSRRPQNRFCFLRVILAHMPYLQGTTLDVVQEGLTRRVRFDNPNARQSCGCGQSFGV